VNGGKSATKPSDLDALQSCGHEQGDDAPVSEAAAFAGAAVPGATMVVDPEQIVNLSPRRARPALGVRQRAVVPLITAATVIDEPRGWSFARDRPAPAGISCYIAAFPPEETLRPMPAVPASIDATLALLRDGGYVPDRALATVLFLSLRMGRPLFLEGEAGVGKTEIAKVLSDRLGRRLIRLQCYEGLDVASAVY
jgi:hypothetical protein